MAAVDGWTSMLVLSEDASCRFFLEDTRDLHFFYDKRLWVFAALKKSRARSLRYFRTYGQLSCAHLGGWCVLLWFPGFCQFNWHGFV